MKLFILGLLLFISILSALAFPPDANAGMDWACKNGAETLQNYVDRIKKLERRSYIKIDNAGEYQVVVIVLDGVSQASVNLFINQCALFSDNIPLRNAVGTYDLDLKQIFPVIKKGSY